MTHIRGQGDGKAVQNSFDTYRPTMAGNRDGLKTAYTTSFTTANNFLVAPVAHAVQGNASSRAGTPAEKEAYLEAQRAWLTEFNGLAGDVAGTLVRALVSPEQNPLLLSEAHWAQSDASERCASASRDGIWKGRLLEESQGESGRRDHGEKVKAKAIMSADPPVPLPLPPLSWSGSCKVRSTNTVPPLSMC